VFIVVWKWGLRRCSEVEWRKGHGLWDGWPLLHRFWYYGKSHSKMNLIKVKHLYRIWAWSQEAQRENQSTLTCNNREVLKAEKARKSLRNNFPLKTTDFWTVPLWRLAEVHMSFEVKYYLSLQGLGISHREDRGIWTAWTSKTYVKNGKTRYHISELSKLNSQR
jgi:hypothetical protein